MYKVISSGSDGNAVIYDEKILVDCGVPFKALVEVFKKIQIVLLTHIHADHLKVGTLRRLQELRPSVRIATPEYLYHQVVDLKNIDIVEVGKMYDYGGFKISPIKLYHDVENVGYRIMIRQKEDNQYYKILHATDTAHLEGVSAKNYDLYAIEHNYDEWKIQEAIHSAKKEGKYTHAIGSVETHLSWQQAQAFIEKNRKETSEVLELHKSKTFY